MATRRERAGVRGREGGGVGTGGGENLVEVLRKRGDFYIIHM